MTVVISCYGFKEKETTLFPQVPTRNRRDSTDGKAAGCFVSGPYAIVCINRLKIILFPNVTIKNCILAFFKTHKFLN